jgi:F-type H+-transporting ATPase subunit b
MNALMLLSAAEGGGRVGQIALTFGVDWPHLVAQMISFGIVCVILHQFAYKRVLKMLEERRQQIAQGIANTEKINAELARTEAQRQEVIRQATAQANVLIEEARQAASRVQEQEMKKAAATAEQIIAKSREAAQQDYGRMMADLKRAVGRLVVQTTAAVAGKVLTPEDQRRLAEETVKQLRAEVEAG